MNSDKIAVCVSDNVLMRQLDDRAAASTAARSWFAMAMLKAALAIYFERVARPKARLSFGLR